MSDSLRMDSRYDVEFGNVATFTARPGINWDMDKHLLDQAHHALAGLEWIKDLVWLQEPHVVHGPRHQVNGFHSVGWYAKFNSEGYTHLKKHFACKREHVPGIITLEWLGRMMERYVDHLQYAEEDDE